LRDKSLQGLPATADRSQGVPPFSRQQYALSLGGPLVEGKLFWFGAAEYRDQDGAVLVGQRDLATRTIRRQFAAAPLTDFLGNTRLDWTSDGSNRVSLRYSIEDADDTGASTLDRSIGSASQRQASANRYHSVLGTWTRVAGSRSANTLSASWNRYRNQIEPTEPGRQLTFPSIQDGASSRRTTGASGRSSP
jgi:hypothetical protein